MRNGFKSRLAVWAVAALAAGALSCSGERSDLLKCEEDSDCPGDQRCVDGGYCESADSLMGDGGPGDGDPSALLYAAASAEGAPAVVKVTTNLGTCVDEGCTVRVGATVTFEAPEVPGYRFVGWGGYDRCVGTSPVLVLEKLDTDVACVARYVRRYSVRGEVEGGLGHVVALSDAPAALCDGNVCEVDRGGVVVLEAPELEGHRFERWSGAGCEAADGPRVSVEVTDGDVVCTAHYAVRRCGDGVQEADEACDAGDANSDEEPNACREDCSLPRCGDGVLDDGEGCDTGDARSDELPDACRTDCTVPRCGDGVVDASEACDDGNRVDDDACRNDCRSPSCGDGVLDEGEECDDGNTKDGDGCQGTCRRPRCGDGVLDKGEECDDGNMFDNDGCRSDCKHGCVSATECADGLFCNGNERCVNGQCLEGTPPNLDDGVACTVDSCNEAADNVQHQPNDALCQAPAPSCSDGSLTQFAARCTDQGCVSEGSTSSCPDTPSSCQPEQDGSISLLTYTPRCANGTSCAQPLQSKTECRATNTCDRNTRVGRVFEPTCDAAAERCGTRQVAMNDCKLLDDVVCGPRNTYADLTVGQCQDDGTCTSSTTRNTCPTRDPTCSNGTLTSYVPSCSPDTGCGQPTARGSQACPTNAATCEYLPENKRPVHVTYARACADASSCLAGGVRQEKVCTDGTPTCQDTITEMYYPAVCDPAKGCGTEQGLTRSCRRPDERSCNGNVLEVRQARCKAGRGCTFDVEATEQCKVPSCGEKNQICGGCGVNANGFTECLGCRTCPNNGTCVSSASGAFCLSQVIIPNPPIVSP